MSDRMDVLGRTLAVGALASALIACSGKGESPPAELVVEEAQSAQSPSEQGRSAQGQVTEPAPEPMDLLQALRVDLAVSSTTRSLRRGPSLLTDGQLTTAWNSRGDDTSPAIELRLPPTAEVTSIELTAGYTAEGNDGRDLFLANRRIRSVRVSRDGAELGVFPLDPDSRQLQTLDVQGGGGVWRLEFTETVPGSMRRWTETCVSELRVMGHPGGTLIAGGSSRLRFLVGDVEEGLDVEAIAAAAQALGSLGEQPVGSESELLERVALLLTAYAVRCPPWNALRRRILRASEAVVRAADAAASAHGELEWLRCPGPDADPVGVHATREDAEDALEEAEWDLQDATSELQQAVGTWSNVCDRSFRGHEEELEQYLTAVWAVERFRYPSSGASF